MPREEFWCYERDFGVPAARGGCDWSEKNAPSLKDDRLENWKIRFQCEAIVFILLLYYTGGWVYYIIIICYRRDQ